MSMATGRCTEASVEVAQTRVYCLKGGTGRPVLVLHGVEGHEGWLAFHDALADQYTVYAPAHPGYGQTDRPAWMETIAHQAAFYQWFIQELGLQSVALVGVGVGGWIAAEMAIRCSHTLSHLVLVDAAGIRPQQGEIVDIFILPWREAVERSFYDAQHAAEYQRIYGAQPIQDFGGQREAGRSMSIRMCYRPYMYNPALHPLLGKVRVPTLVVWGAEDQIIPIECGHRYQQAIPGANLRVIDRCGHWPHFEHPQALAEVVGEFVST